TYLAFFLSSDRHPRNLHPFPTRRSSDLQTKSGFSVNRSGPGWRPQMMSPPSMTAAVGEPGMPSVIMGSIAATPAACDASHDHARSEEHTSELQSRSDLVCRLLLEKKKTS